jgi:hypothetical protein
MAEEITLGQEVDRILAMQATAIVPDELVREPEPFEDQRSFASVELEETAEPEDPEETEAGQEGTEADAEGLEAEEDDED